MTHRLGWLDALRGYAALVVVCFHVSPQIIGLDAHLAIFRHFDAGKYGVLLFFLVSGYVIPMSLERHGSLRRFWVGRLCRILPAYALAVVLALAIVVVPTSLRQSATAGLLGHLTMLQEFVGVRGLVRVFWTLSYEMVFYLAVAGLFAWRLHRFSAAWAVALAGLALLPLPDGLFAGHPRLLAAVLVAVAGSSIAAHLCGWHRVAGLAGLALLLVPVLNGSPTRWSTTASSEQAVLLLAVMFAGTVLYRLHNGQIGRLTGFLVLAVVAAALVAAAGPWRIWLAGSAAVAVTFAAAYALRNRRLPRVLTWLGAVSYSLYLLHPLVLTVFGRIIPAGRTWSPPVLLAYFAITLTVAWLSYRLVERPGQALGRRLAPPVKIATQRVAAPTSDRVLSRRSV